MSHDPAVMQKDPKHGWSKPCVIVALLLLSLRMTVVEYWLRGSHLAVESAINQSGNWSDESGVAVELDLFAAMKPRTWLWIQTHLDAYGPLHWSQGDQEYYVDGQAVEAHLKAVADSAAPVAAVLLNGLHAQQRLHWLALCGGGLEALATLLYSFAVVVAWRECRAVAGDPPVSLLARGATVLEDYILPAVYLYLAWTILAGPDDLDLFNSSGFWSKSWHQWTKSDTAQLISSAMLFAIQFSIVIFLLTNRRPAARYRTLPEIFVPLLVAFFFITYDYTYLLPPGLKDSLLAHDPRQGEIAFIGLLFGALGGVVSVWGILSLGRSFGILVAVRKVVLRGPYRFIRHPIYLGYFLALIGMLLADPEPIYFALLPTLYAIMSWRARLEENKLAAVSIDYRANMSRTGMFFPRMPWQRRLTYVPEGFEIAPIKRK